jgi:hypothetical protein
MSSKTNVIQHKPAQVIEAPRNPMEMLAFAVSQNADLDRIKQLMELKKEWEADEARKAYVAAMASFKAEPIEILKTKYVDIPGGAKFNHATLADVVDGAVAAMGKHGLSHKWETKQEAGLITVTCVLTHSQGHSERTTLSAPPDDSGKKNSIQQVASTVTYLERYTLMAACGLAAKDMDDDARSAGKGGNSQRKMPDAPAGYDEWADNLRAVVDEGRATLYSVWKNSPMPNRAYMAKYDSQRWDEMKKLSEKADHAMGAA